MRLPFEVRGRIYAHLGLGDSGLEGDVLAPRIVRPWPCPSAPYDGAKECTQPKRPLVPLALFRINKRINAEVSDLSYRRWSLKVATAVQCTCPRRSFDGPVLTPHKRTIVELRRLLGWMRHIGPQNRQWLRFLTLDIPYRHYFRQSKESRDEFVWLVEEIGRLLTEGKSPKTLVVKGLTKDDGLSQSSAAELAMEALARSLRNVQQVVYNGVNLSDHEAAEKAVNDKVISASMAPCARAMLTAKKSSTSSESGKSDASAKTTETGGADTTDKKPAVSEAAGAESAQSRPNDAKPGATPAMTAAEFDAQVQRDVRLDCECRRAVAVAVAKADQLWPAPLETLPALWQEGAEDPGDLVFRTERYPDLSKHLHDGFRKMRSHPDLCQSARDIMDMCVSEYRNGKQRRRKGKRITDTITFDPKRAEIRHDKYIELEKQVYEKAVELPW